MSHPKEPQRCSRRVRPVPRRALVPSRRPEGRRERRRPRSASGKELHRRGGRHVLARGKLHRSGTAPPVPASNGPARAQGLGRQGSGWAGLVDGEPAGKAGLGCSCTAPGRASAISERSDAGRFTSSRTRQPNRSPTSPKTTAGPRPAALQRLRRGRKARGRGRRPSAERSRPAGFGLLVPRRA